MLRSAAIAHFENCSCVVIACLIIRLASQHVGLAARPGNDRVHAQIHSKGLLFGLYGDRGTLDCDKRPGQLGHETQDAAYFASIGVDWFKSDSCYDSDDEATAIRHYAAMRDAFNATGRPVWFALCGWKPFYAPPNKAIGYAGGLTLANRCGPVAACRQHSMPTCW